MTMATELTKLLNHLSASAVDNPPLPPVVMANVLVDALLARRRAWGLPDVHQSNALPSSSRSSDERLRASRSHVRASRSLAPPIAFLFRVNPSIIRCRNARKTRARALRLAVGLTRSTKRSSIRRDRRVRLTALLHSIRFKRSGERVDTRRRAGDRGAMMRAESLGPAMARLIVGADTCEAFETISFRC